MNIAQRLVDSEQPLSENKGTSQMNDSKCFFLCNVKKMQEDFL